MVAAAVYAIGAHAARATYEEAHPKRLFGRPYIIVAFHTDDCGSRMGALASWNRVARGVTVPVRGALLDADPSDTVTITNLARAGVGLIVHEDMNNTIAEQLRVTGHTRTPVVIVYDSADRVRLILDPPANTASWSQASIDRLLRFSGDISRGNEDAGVPAATIEPSRGSNQ